MSDRLILLVALAVSLGFNIYQHFTWGSGDGGDKPLAEGVSLIDLSVTDLNHSASSLRLRRDGPPTLMYVFSPSCHWCKRNLQPMQALMSLEKTQYSTVGVSLTDLGLSQYLRENPMPFPVYVVSPQTASKVGLMYTPETIVIDKNGQVLRTWIGAYSNNTKNDLQNYFRVSLPEPQAADVDSSATCVGCEAK
jgi:peroxiredoxin